MAHHDHGAGSRLRIRLRAACLTVALVGAIGGCTPSPGTPQAPGTVAGPATSPGTTQPAPAPPSADCPDSCRGEATTIGSFPARRAPEASGLVASRRHDDILYVLDDGPGTTGVLVVSATDASVVGRIEISGLQGTDTESLAAGPCDPEPGRCIYVGDIGDNLRQRANVTISRFREPPNLRGATTVTADSITLQYPDRSHDAEALLVDASGTIAIVTKAAGARGRGAARLYTADGFADATLTGSGRLPVPQPDFGLLAMAVGNVVTGGDWAPGRVALRTYDAVFEYVAPDDSAALRDLASWEVNEIDVASEPQSEAVAYGQGGCSIFTVSEGSGKVRLVPCEK